MAKGNHNQGGKTSKKSRKKHLVSSEVRRRLEAIDERYSNVDEIVCRLPSALARITLHIDAWSGLYFRDPNVAFEDTPVDQLVECDYVFGAISEFVSHWKCCAEERSEKYSGEFLHALKFSLDTLEGVIDDIHYEYDDYLGPNSSFFFDMRKLLEDSTADVYPDAEWQVLAFGLELIEWRAHDCTDYPRNRWLFVGTPETQANRSKAREEWVASVAVDGDIPVFREMGGIAEYGYADKVFSKQPFSGRESVLYAALCVDSSISYLSVNLTDPDDGSETRQYVSLLFERQRQFAIHEMYDYCEVRSKVAVIPNGRMLWMQAASMLPDVPEDYFEHISEVQTLSKDKAVAFVKSIQELSCKEWVARKSAGIPLSIDWKAPAKVGDVKKEQNKQIQSGDRITIQNCQNVQLSHGVGDNIQKTNEPPRWKVFPWVMKIVGGIIVSVASAFLIAHYGNWFK